MSKRVGISFGGEISIESMLSYVKLAEERGFDSVWMAEDIPLRDAITPLTAFAYATRNIKLGIGIITPYTRHPAIITMTLATLDEFSGKRLLFGIGEGVRSQIEGQLGIGMKGLTAMKECIHIVKQLLERKTLSFEGEVYKIKNFQLFFNPIRSHIPVYMAAMGRQSLRLSGEIADGVILSAGVSLKHVEYAIENIHIGAQRIARDPASIDIACNVITSVAEDRNKAREMTKPILAFMTSFQPFGEILLSTSGLKTDVLSDIRRGLQDKGIEGAVEEVTDEMIDLLTVSGTQEECIKKLDKYWASGVKLITIMPVGDIKGAIEIGYTARGRS